MKAIALEPSERYPDADRFAEAVAAARRATSVAPSKPRHTPARGVSQSSANVPAAVKALAGTMSSTKIDRSQSRYSVTPSGNEALSTEVFESGERRAASAPNAFEVLQELESEATAALKEKDWKAAASALERGVGAARRFVKEGDVLGESALASFGRRLGETYRRIGKFDESNEILREVLDVATLRDTSRATVLEQVAATAVARGGIDEASEALTEAMSIAEEVKDDDLFKRLRGRALDVVARSESRKSSASLRLKLSGSPPSSASPKGSGRY